MRPSFSRPRVVWKSGSRIIRSTRTKSDSLFERIGGYRKPGYGEMRDVCFHCGESIEEGEARIACANGPVAHRNCFLRGVIGSVAHVLKACRCYVRESTLGDPEGMSRREAADAAVLVWEARNEMGAELGATATGVATNLLHEKRGNPEGVENKQD
jgi:hypothetical protein